MAHSGMDTTIPQSSIQHLSEDENDGGKYVSCNTIRKKITLFLATKQMTQTAFLTAIGGVNSNSLGRFMKLKGPHKGIDNGTYWGARNFFAIREKGNKAAMKEAKVKEKATAIKRSSASSVIVLSADGSNRKIAKTSIGSTVEPLAALVELPKSVPVFDDCDEVRTKIGQCIHKKELTQSGFAKAIGLTPAAVSRFLSRKGYNQGGASTVYHNAYRYFEKERLQRGEPKSAHRTKNEINYPQGYPLINPPTHEWVQSRKVGKKT